MPATSATVPRRARIDAARETTAQPVDGSPRARHLAARLIELHRLERSVEQPARKELDLVTLVVTIAHDYPGVEVQTSTQGWALTSDSRHLAGLLFELFDNAFIHGRPPVTVRIERPRIVVCDTGPGFGALGERATQRFVSGSSPRRAGLGLPIALHHARSLGASLEIGDAGERGAEAIITLV